MSSLSNELDRYLAIRRSLGYALTTTATVLRAFIAFAERAGADGLRRLTFPVLFGVLAVTGLRINEVLALDVSDVDLEAGILTVQRGKFGKARLLPISESTRIQLATYAKERDRLLGACPKSFFVTDRGKRPSDSNARYSFVVVCQRIGLRPARRFDRIGGGPRIHDLRHTFAVRTLVTWYRSGKDPAKEMIKLTTYLGHTSLVDTYWYIEAVPELLQLASKRATISLAREDRI